MLALGMFHPCQTRALAAKLVYHVDMTEQAIDQELSREPFIPLRLHLDDGRTIDIENPGLALIAKLALYVARTDRPHSRIMDDFRLISLAHIVSVELLEPAGRSRRSKK